MAAKSSSNKKFTGVIGTTISVATKDYERREQKQLEISGLDEEGIKSLRKTDPFMYYSIMKGQGRNSGRSSKAKSVARCTAISFESHPSLLLAQFFDDPNPPLWDNDCIDESKQ
jgi:hypothetical protein